MAAKKQLQKSKPSVTKSVKEISTKQKPVTKSGASLQAKRVVPESVQAAGQAALKLYREARAKAKAKGPKAYAEWEAEQKLKQALKKTTPMMAIKNFCNSCVETRQHVKNCTSFKCPLYIYRPYQSDKEAD